MFTLTTYLVDASFPFLSPFPIPPPPNSSLSGASVDIIKTRGFKVSALEIESKLLEHPLISEAAVLGVPERQQGEAVAAVVVLGAAQQQHHTQGQRHGATGGGDTGGGVTETSEAAPGEHAAITLDELRKWATPRMAHYKVPSRLRVVATMPRNAMGKVRQQQEHGMQHAMQ
ncbi:unnamed protein product [Closterium sp. NIES-54]